MGIRHVWLLAWLFLAGAGLALDNAVPNAPDIEGCERMIVPTYVFTLGLDIDFDVYAEERLEQDQDVSLIRNVYQWEEPVPFAIFVDLLQDQQGGLIQIDIFDQFDNLTWSTIQPVPPLMAGIGLEREVIPVEIPLFQMETAFPRTSVYTIRASTYPDEGQNDPCVFSASTSVVIEPSYPSMHP